jgi:hypothetical protein
VGVLFFAFLMIWIVFMVRFALGRSGLGRSRATKKATRDEWLIGAFPAPSRQQPPVSVDVGLLLELLAGAAEHDANPVGEFRYRASA